MPFEDQLKKIAHRAPGSELRFSDVGGICSPAERKHQTARRRDRYYNLPGCGWVQFKGRRKNGIREIEPITPDAGVKEAFWSRYGDRCAPRMLYQTTDGTVWMPGSLLEFCRMI